MAKNQGTVIQVVGPVLDIRFDDGCLPELLAAIEIKNGDATIVAEVAQHNAITLTQSIGNQFDCLLDDVKHLVLRETVVQLSAYLVNKLSLSNRICHK